ncbi:allatostatin-A receptor-like [Periplaneta americana]|uniref:allatostatin-A receptor-like n=1 Tax=Periplaneta americana TaxID=6978 RepID=UPI0037E95FED
MATEYDSNLNVTTMNYTDYSVSTDDFTENSSLFKEAPNYAYDFPNLIYMDNPEEMLKPWVINPMFFNIVITHSVTFLVGLVGNVVVVIVMVGDRKSRSATNLFLVSLAVADLLLLLVYAPLETLQYFVMQWDESGAVCKLAMYALLLSAVVSVFNLAAVTLERFIVIVYPMKSRSLCTISNCRKAILLVWCLSLLITSPVVLTKETYPIVYSNNVTNVTLHYCNETEQSGNFAIYQLLVLFCAPGTLMVVCYTYVIRELWRSTRNMQMLTNSVSTKKSKLHNGSPEMSTGEVHFSNGSTTCRHGQVNKGVKRQNKGEDARRARKQVIKMLILVIVLFLVCWGLRIIMEVIIKFNLHSFTPTIYKLRITCNLLPLIHTCMNPFIYSFMSKNFRRSLQRQLEKMGCRRRTHSGNSTRTGHGSSLRTSKVVRGTPTMQRSWQGLKLKSGRNSTSSTTTNCLTDLTKHTDVDPVLLALHPATSAV